MVDVSLSDALVWVSFLDVEVWPHGSGIVSSEVCVVGNIQV